MKSKVFKIALVVPVVAILALLLSAAGAESGDDFHHSLTVIDTHCDTPYLLLDPKWDIGRWNKRGERGSGKQDFPRMKAGGLDGSFFAVYVAQREVNEQNMQQAHEQALRLLDALDGMFARHGALCEKALASGDVAGIGARGKVAVWLGMENGFPLKRDIRLLDYFYKRGIRYATLSHSRDNQLCDSSTDSGAPEDNGLSDFGRQVVARMNDIGMIIDISHVSDRTALEVLGLSRAPVIASHSSTRALCDIPRNIPDNVLLELKKNGGVVQLCPLSDFVKKSDPASPRQKAFEELRKRVDEQYGGWGNIRDEQARQKLENEYEAIDRKYQSERAGISDFVDHIDHVVKLIGIDHAGIGTDFDGGGGLRDLRDVTDLPLITAELLRRGYSREDVAKIWGLNFLRVFRKVEEARREKIE